MAGWRTGYTAWMTEVITSRANPRIKQLRAAFAGQARLSQGLIAIEGPHLLEEALATRQAIKTIFVAERTDLPAGLPAGVEVLRVAGDVFASAADTESPRGLAALLVPPLPNLLEMLRGTPLIVIAAGLQDPGNLGTLIRSALAFGATGVLTTPGTVSAFNPKAMRASAGAVFRMPLATADEATMKTLREHGVIVLASVKDGAEDAAAVDLTCGCALLIGNEGAGLAAEWLTLAGARVTIPMPGPVESLNAAVAGSLLLYEAARQRAARAGEARAHGSL